MSYAKRINTALIGGGKQEALSIAMQADAEIAALRSDAELWRMTKALWHYPGKTLEEIVRRVAEERGIDAARSAK